jgi:hypothetical protein
MSAAPDVTLETDALGFWHDYDGLVAQLKSWVEMRGISYETLDALSNLAKGHSGKLLGDAQVRHLSSFSLLAMMATLGIRCRFEEDPDAVAQMTPHWEPCDVAQRRTQRRAPIGKKTMERVIPDVARELGRRGAAALNGRLTPAQRRASARKAGLASGRARLRRGLMEVAEASRS